MSARATGMGEGLDDGFSTVASFGLVAVFIEQAVMAVACVGVEGDIELMRPTSGAAFLHGAQGTVAPSRPGSSSGSEPVCVFAFGGRLGKRAMAGMRARWRGGRGARPSATRGVVDAGEGCRPPRPSPSCTNRPRPGRRA